MDHVGVDKAHFVGLSLGGMTGLYMAIHHADRLLSLASCDARAWSPPDYIEAWVGRMAIAREKGMEALVEPTIERWFTAPFRADPVKRAGAGSGAPDDPRDGGGRLHRLRRSPARP